MNLFTVYKVFEAVMSVVGGRKEARGETPAPEDGRPLAQTFANQVETRLTNIVVAALKEAFDRDHQRLELERARLDEERRFAEERARMEAWRRAVDREIGRLRVLTGAGVLGWITSVALLIVRADNMYAPARAVLLGGSGLLLLSLAAAFTAQATIGTLRETDGSLRTKAATASLSFLIAGMAAAAISLVI